MEKKDCENYFVAENLIENVEPKLLEEIIEKRDVNVKHFKLSNGNCRAVLYSYSIHTQNTNEEYVDIVNVEDADSFQLEEKSSVDNMQANLISDNITTYYKTGSTVFEGEPLVLIKYPLGTRTDAYFTIPITAIGAYNMPVSVKLNIYKNAGTAAFLQVFDEEGNHIDYLEAVGANGKYVANITSAYAKSKTQTIKINGTLGTDISFHSENSTQTEFRPYVEIDYIPNQKVDEYQKYINGTVGDRVSYSVNIRTGKLLVEYQDISLEGCKLPTNIKHVFMAEKCTTNTLFSTRQTYMQYGWKTNFHQYLYSSGDNYIYIDSKGDYHTFVVSENADTTNPIYYDTHSSGLKLVTTGVSYPTITDIYGNIMEFSSNRLKTFTDKYGNSMNMTFNTSIFYRNKMLSLTDGMGRTTSFSYSSNRMNRMTRPDGKYLSYTTSSNRLTSASYGGITTSFTYTSAGMIASILDANKEKVVFTYNNLKEVIAISEYKMNDGVDTLINSIEFNRYPNIVETKNNKNVMIAYGFDENGLYLGSSEISSNKASIYEYYLANRYKSSGLVDLYKIPIQSLSNNRTLAATNQPVSTIINVENVEIIPGKYYCLSCFADLFGAKTKVSTDNRYAKAKFEILYSVSETSAIMKITKNCIYNMNTDGEQFLLQYFQIPKEYFYRGMTITLEFNTFLGSAKFYGINAIECTSPIEYDCVKDVYAGEYCCSIWKLINNVKTEERWYRLGTPSRMTYVDNNNVTQNIYNIDFTGTDFFFNELSRKGKTSSDRYDVWLNNGKMLITQAKSINIYYSSTSATLNMFTRRFGRGIKINYDKSLNEIDVNIITYNSYSTGDNFIQAITENQREKLPPISTDIPPMQTSKKYYNSKFDLVKTQDTRGRSQTLTYDSTGNVTYNRVYNSSATSNIQQQNQYANDFLRSQTAATGQSSNYTLFTSEANTGNVTEQESARSLIVNAEYNSSDNERLSKLTTEIATDLNADGTNELVPNILSYQYSGRNLQSVTKGYMQDGVEVPVQEYGFEYGVYDNISRVTVNSNAIIEKAYTLTTSNDTATTTLGNYSETNTYDKYGRPTLVGNNNGTMLTNIYTSKTGTELDNITIPDSTSLSGDLLKKSIDSITGEVTLIDYNKNGSIANVNIKNGSTVKYNEELSYDENNRLKINVLNYNSTVFTSEFDYRYNFAPVSGSVPEETSAIETTVSIGQSSSKFMSAITYEGLKRINTMNCGQSVNNVNCLIEKNFTYPSSTTTTSLPFSVRYDKVRVENLTPTITNLYTHYFTYDNDGNITKISKYNDSVHAAQKDYGYDKLGRLTNETDRDTGTVFVKNYTYGVGGNKATESTIINGITELRTFNYNNTWKDQLTSVVSTIGGTPNWTYNFAYDSVGNPTTYKNSTLTWTRGKLMSSYGSYSYTYNASGIRTTKYDGTRTRTFLLRGNNVIGEKITAGTATTTISYLYDETGVCGVIRNGDKFHFMKNIQGDVIAIYDINNAIIATYAYDAWGNHKVYNSSGVEIPNTYTTSIANQNPFRYRGYYYDVETGLYYLKSRYYDPFLGRFLNADHPAYLAEGLLDFNGNNLYSYCDNNPVNMLDADGHMPKWLTWTLAGLAVAGLVALTAVSFGIAAPLGISVLIGIVIGAGIGGAAAAISGANGEGIFLGAISGGLIGGSMAFACGLGLMAGAAYLAGAATIAATGIGAGISIGGALGIASLTGGAAYALAYSINTGANNREFNWGKFAGSFIVGGIFATANFGIGFVLGYAGMGYGQINTSSSKVAFYTCKTIFKSIAFGGLSWVIRQILS